MIRIRHRFRERIAGEHAPAPRQLAAAAKLDAVRPDAARDLLPAMDNNPALERVMGELQGRECTTQPVAVLREEQPQEDRSMNDLPEHDEDGGGAAWAFEGLRAEMSVLRRAVKALPAAWTDNQPPDYMAASIVTGGR